MGIKRVYTRPRSELTQEQKVAFVLLAFLGIGGLVFGFRSFGANLNRPIHQQIVDNFTGEEYLSPDQKLSKEREKQRKQDTDFDGLNDYDELYVYRSSPYLKDTDSDGLDDKIEVFAGQDPNCAEGKDCGPVDQSEEVISTTQTDVENVLSVFEDPKAALEAGAVTINGKEDVDKLFNQISTQQLRDALLKTGMPKSQLDMIDDATLEAYFAGARSEIEASQTEQQSESNTSAEE